MNTRKLVHWLCLAGFLLAVMIVLGATTMRAASRPSGARLVAQVPEHALAPLTGVSGQIVTNTVWTLPGSPYIVTGDVTVNPNVTLAISPGVEVRFDGNYALVVRGTLSAEGTASQPIRFTSNQPSPAPGDWAFIDFRAEGTASVLRHAIVEYGGNGTRAGSSCVAGALCVNTSSFELDQSTVQHNATRGLVLVQSDATVTGNTFDDHGDEAVRLHGCNYNIGPCRPTFSGNTFTRNASAISFNSPQDPVLTGNGASANDTNGLVLSNCALKGDNTWHADLPYVVPGWCILGGYGPVSLTIEAGAVVKIGGGGLEFKYTSVLTAAGTAEQPVTFTSLKDDSVGGDTNNDGSDTTPARNDYHHVLLNGADARALFEHAAFRYGGGAKAGSGPNLLVDYGASLAMRDCDLSQSEVGVAAWRSANLTLEDSTLHDNSFAGVDASSDGQVRIAGNEFLSAGSGVYVYAGRPVVEQNLFGENTWGVQVICTTQFGGDCAPLVSPYNEFEGAAQVGIEVRYPDWVHVDARRNWWGAASGPYHATRNPDGTGNPVSDGVRFDPWLQEYTWLGPEETLFHGVESLHWAVFGREPGALTVDIGAHGQDTHDLGTGLAASGSLDWDTQTAADGRYELRAVFREGTPAVAGEAVRAVAVNNSPSVSWHGGRIDASETWAADQVHVVESTVRIGSGVQVTVSPSGTVKFAPGTQILVEDGGRLEVQSAGTSPTVLTSLADDTAGGDTNVDGSQTLPRAGDWDGLVAQGAGQIELTAYVELRFMRTAHGGTLVASESWSGTFLHVVTEDVIVPGGVTLTLEPGAVLKFEPLTGVTVQSGGTLSAQGTVAQPIVLTSIRDDEQGGDSNGDGDTTAPAPGDWLSLHVDGGEASLDHVQIRYAGGSATGSWNYSAALRSGNGASVTLTNSVLDLAFYDGVLVQGGATSLQNCLVTGADRGIVAWLAAATVHVHNCTLDDNRIGLLAHGGTADVVNSIVANSLGVGIDRDILPDPVVRYSNVWSTAGLNYRNVADPTGLNGNVSVDPQFKDAERGNYRLGYASPMIDAADGTVAPETDAMGAPRYDDPRTANTGLPGSGGAYADMGAYEFVETADSRVDLLVTHVEGPSAATVGQEVSLAWTLVNSGTESAVGPWHDAIVLVGSSETIPAITLVDEVRVGAGLTLGPGQSYEASAQVRIPGTREGAQYWAVSTNSQNDVFEGRHTANNTGYALAPVEIDITDLVIDGAPLAGEFTAAGESQWFRFTPELGQHIVVSLDLAGESAISGLYAGYKYVPTDEGYDASHREWNAADTSLSVADTLTGTYYVLARTTLPSAFQLRAETVEFAATGVRPAAGGNAGQVTVAIHGEAIPGDATARLVRGTAEVPATAVHRVDSTQLDAVFDLRGVPAGLADVVLISGGLERTLADAFEVQEGGTADFWWEISGPELVRIGRPAEYLVTWGNRGNVDAPVHLMLLTGSSLTSLSLASTEEDISAGYQFLAMVPEAATPAIPPGSEESLAFLVTATDFGGFTLSAHAIALTDPALVTEPVDWEGMRASARPDQLTEEQWNALLDELIAGLGSNWAQVAQTLAEDSLAWLHDAGAPLFPHEPGIELRPALLAAIGRAETALGWDSLSIVAPAAIDAESGPGEFIPVLIAVEDHAASRKLGRKYGDLPGKRADVRNIVKMLRDLGQLPVGRFKGEDFKGGILTDTKVEIEGVTPRAPTSANVEKTLRNTALHAGEEDTIFLYIATHANSLRPFSEDGYILLGDGTQYDFKRILRDISYKGAEATAARRIVIFLDVCEAEHLVYRLQNHNDVHPDVKPRIGVIAAARLNQDSYESDDGGDATLTWIGRMANLRSDRNKDGFVSPEEAFDEMPEQLAGWWRRNILGHSQEPLKYGNMLDEPLLDAAGGSKEGMKDHLRNDHLGHLVPRAGAWRTAQGLGGGGQDPNDKVAAGQGVEGWIRPGGELVYTIHFENIVPPGVPPELVWPAQVVVITDQLSSHLDWSTFALGNIGFAHTIVRVPAGRQVYASYEAVEPDPNPVAVTAALDVATGRVVWRMQSTDLGTGLLPEDPVAGFLPANDETHIGEGFVSFLVRPLADLPDGTQITNRASIVFDVNEPIWTNVVTNTIGTPPQRIYLPLVMRGFHPDGVRPAGP
jgi:hypothetical protein